MSIAVHLRDPAGDSYCVDVGGGETLKDLYRKAGSAIGVEEGTFWLCFEGRVLGAWGRMGETVEGSWLCEGSEVDMQLRDRMSVHVTELGDEAVHRRVQSSLEEDPEGILSVDISGVAGVLRVGKIPEGVRHLVFTRDTTGPTAHTVTEVAPGFLQGCRSLLSVDITLLSSVTTIGNGFMMDCESLASFDFSPLSNVTSIGDLFLRGVGCASLDLSPMAKVASVGKEFLNHCGTRTITWSTPSRITAVPDYFLSYCPSLVSADLEGITNTTSIGNWFLARCSGLQAADLSPLRNVRSIGDSFLRGVGCVSVDLTPLTQVEAIGADFLEHCHTRRVMWSQASKVTHVPQSCFGNCPFLEAVDLRGLVNVTNIGSWFLIRCSSLQAVDLTPLHNVATVGEGLLEFCNVRSITWAHPSRITEVPNFFVSSCSSLESVDLRGLANVVSIGDWFLTGSSKLQSIDLSPLRNVVSIGNAFLRGVGCASVDLTPLSQVCRIGTQFLEHCNAKRIMWARPSRVKEVSSYCFYCCRALESVDLRGFGNATSIGMWFLTSCSSLQTVDFSPLCHVTRIDRRFLGYSPLECADLTPLTEVEEVEKEDTLSGCRLVRVGAGSVLERELCALPVVAVRKRKAPPHSGAGG